MKNLLAVMAILAFSFVLGCSDEGGNTKKTGTSVATPSGTTTHVTTETKPSGSAK